MSPFTEIWVIRESISYHQYPVCTEMTEADLKTRWWLPHWQPKMLESPGNSCCNTGHEQDLETLKAFGTGRDVWMLCFCSYDLIDKGTILFEIIFLLKEDRSLRHSRASIELLWDWLTPSFLRNSPIIQTLQESTSPRGLEVWGLSVQYHF